MFFCVCVTVCYYICIQHICAHSTKQPITLFIGVNIHAIMRKQTFLFLQVCGSVVNAYFFIELHISLMEMHFFIKRQQFDHSNRLHLFITNFLTVKSMMLNNSTSPQPYNL